MKNPVVSMITPGRRAIGEKWSKVNIMANDSTGGYDVVREDTAAPADNTPIIVPGMGNLSVEMTDFILESQRKEAEYRARNPKRVRAEDDAARINQLWFEYMEWKVKMLQGKTVSGPAGWSQRERIQR